LRTNTLIFCDAGVTKSREVIGRKQIIVLDLNLVKEKGTLEKKEVLR
jgi:hypothetical protein